MRRVKRHSGVLVPTATLRARMHSVGRTLVRAPREFGTVVSAPISTIAAVSLALTLVLFAFDETLSRLLIREPGEGRVVLGYLTDVALIKWYFYPALAASLFLLLFRHEPVDAGARRRRAMSFVHFAYLTASLGLATTITHAAKWILGRSRPALIEENGAMDFALLRIGDLYESFPSGHSNNAGVLAMSLAIWFPALRWPILLAGAALATTRILVGAHFPSDVVAGFTIGSLTALALARYLARRRIVYRFVAGGHGWRGLLPYRPAGRDASFSAGPLPEPRNP